MVLTITRPPVLIALILITKATLARAAPDMLRRRLKMLLQITARLESQETRQTCELMSDAVVIFEMIPQAPLVLERRKAKIAIDVMIQRVVDVVLQPIPILEHALAEITVVLVALRLLDVGEERRLVRQLERTDATPILIRIEGFIITFSCGSRRGAITPWVEILASWHRPVPVFRAQCQASDWRNRRRCRSATLPDLFPWYGVVSDLVCERVLRGVDCGAVHESYTTLCAGE